MKIVQRAHGFTTLAEGQTEVRSVWGAASGWNQVPSLDGSQTHGVLPSLQALPVLPPFYCSCGIATGYRTLGHYRNAFWLSTLCHTADYTQNPQHIKL